MRSFLVKSAVFFVTFKSKPKTYKYMNNPAKCYVVQIINLIAVCFIFSAYIHAQTDRNALKLQNLENKITMAESKVAAAELKLSVADSLITSGDLRISQAEEYFAQIEEEQKKLEKEYRINSRALHKLAKSKDKETAEKAEEDLKELNTRYKEEARLQETEIKNLTRQASRARSDIDKGLDMQKTATQKLKDAHKALEIAKKNHESFAETLEGESSK